jgi:hypothetical protein
MNMSCATKTGGTATSDDAIREGAFRPRGRDGQLSKLNEVRALVTAPEWAARIFERPARILWSRSATFHRVP